MHTVPHTKQRLSAAAKHTLACRSTLHIATCSLTRTSDNLEHQHSILCAWSVRLEDAGYGVGLRLLEALSYRERGSRREVRLIEMLKFVHTTLWKCLFGRQARELEQSNTVGCCMFADALQRIDVSGVYVSILPWIAG